MNDRFFACTDCKVLINAGGQWCRWVLEDENIVRVQLPVDVARVLAHARYWAPPDDENGRSWLPVLTPVKPFLQSHRDHHVVFLTDNDVWSLGDDHLLEWLRVGWNAGWTPRHFVEVLGITRWEEVVKYMSDHAANADGQRWFLWLDDSERERFRLKFEAFVRKLPA